MRRAFLTLVLLTGAASATTQAGAEGQLPSAAAYRAAQMMVVEDMSVLSALFEDGHKFSIRVVDSPDGDQNVLVRQVIFGDRFRGEHPMFGVKDFAFEFRSPNSVLIHWPKVDYTYHVACGMIGVERHCVLVHRERRAWGFRDPRVWVGL
jgi:hypothetical protein